MMAYWIHWQSTYLRYALLILNAPTTQVTSNLFTSLYKEDAASTFSSQPSKDDISCTHVIIHRCHRLIEDNWNTGLIISCCEAYLNTIEYHVAFRSMADIKKADITWYWSQLMIVTDHYSSVAYECFCSQRCKAKRSWQRIDSNP